MRFILIFIELAVIVMVLKRLWQASDTEKDRQIPSNRMVQCAHCGIYTPEADAMEYEGKYYCTQAHLDEDRQD